MKRTTNFILVSALLSLVACQEIENIDKSEVEPPLNEVNVLPSRLIIKEGVHLWQACYRQLVKDSVFGSVGVDDTLCFSVDSLLKLKGLSPEDINVDFWIYLDDGNVPKYAIANENDSANLLINSEGENQFVSFQSLKPKLDAWKDLTKRTFGGLVYVKVYRYNWQNLLDLIDSNNTLCIENVAHTVESNSAYYEVLPKSSNGVQVEGYIALDLILWGQGGFNQANSIWETSNKYDFAMPCPKNCP